MKLRHRLLLLPLLLAWLNCCGPGDGGSSAHEVGDTCMTDKDCGAGMRCIPSEGGAGICTETCDQGTCPEGYRCALMDETKGALCYPLSEEHACARCRDDGACVNYGAWCLDYDGEGRCLLDCATDPCPEGFECSDVGGRKVCLPTGDGVDCDCNALKEGMKRPCERSNEYGTCHGVRVCHGIHGWGECTAPEPMPETCDGSDNDCDGEVDEGLINTPDNCGECGHVCPGEGIPGTRRVCNDGECGLECIHDATDSLPDYYDSNGDLEDGCECVDDDVAPHTARDTVSLGSFTDCDFSRQIAGAVIPVDVHTGPAPADYYQFHFDEVWNCQLELGVALTVLDSSVPHTICISPANEKDETKWRCYKVQPGETKKIDDVYTNDGVYYIKIYVDPADVPDGEGDCAEYLLLIKDPI